MITDYNITECIIEDEYENYYKPVANWERKEQIQAEIADIAYEDSLFEED